MINKYFLYFCYLEIIFYHSIIYLFRRFVHLVKIQNINIKSALVSEYFRDRLYSDINLILIFVQNII